VLFRFKLVLLSLPVVKFKTFIIKFGKGQKVQEKIKFVEVQTQL